MTTKLDHKKVYVKKHRRIMDADLLGFVTEKSKTFPQAKILKCFFLLCAELVESESCILHNMIVSVLGP